MGRAGGSACSQDVYVPRLFSLYFDTCRQSRVFRAFAIRYISASELDSSLQKCSCFKLFINIWAIRFNFNGLNPTDHFGLILPSCICLYRRIILFLGKSFCFSFVAYSVLSDV